MTLMYPNQKLTYLFLGLVIAFVSIIYADQPAASFDDDGWVDLLEGGELEQWKLFPRRGKQSARPENKWFVQDGVLLLGPSEEGVNGHLATVKDYFNFEFKFEFRLGVKANSGVKYRTEGYNGLEYQLNDDIRKPDHRDPLNKTGCIYLFSYLEEKHLLKTDGSWNVGRIVADGDVIEHWLNGVKVAAVVYGSEDWKQSFSASKYSRGKGAANFAKTAGSLILQGYADAEMSFRKLYIREL